MARNSWRLSGPLPAFRGPAEGRGRPAPCGLQKRRHGKAAWKPALGVALVYSRGRQPGPDDKETRGKAAFLARADFAPGSVSPSLCIPAQAQRWAPSSGPSCPTSTYFNLRYRHTIDIRNGRRQRAVATLSPRCVTSSAFFPIGILHLGSEVEQAAGRGWYMMARTFLTASLLSGWAIETCWFPRRLVSHSSKQS